MSRLSKLVLFCVITLSVPQVAVAQAKQGDTELQLFGFISTLYREVPEIPGFLEGGSTSTTTGTAVVGLGYFLTDRLQIGASPLITISTGGGIGGSEGSTDVTFGLSTNVQYFFGANDAKIKPYVGYELQIQSFESPEGGSLADNTYNSGVFGLKNYLSERAALDINAGYGFRMSGPGDGQSLNLRVGITYLF